ncbi:MAG: hypothetical protein ABSH53_00070 [Holophaga sp.]
MTFPTHCFRLAFIVMDCLALHPEEPAIIKNLSDRPWRLISYGTANCEIRITCMDLDGTQVTKRFPPMHEMSETKPGDRKTIVNQINMADFYAIDVTIIPNTYVTITADDCAKDFSQVFHLVDLDNQENSINYGSLVLTVRQEVPDRLAVNARPARRMEIRPTGADSGFVLNQESSRTLQILRGDWGEVPTRHFKRWRERYRGGAPWEADAVRDGVDPGPGIRMWRGARKAALGDVYLDKNSLEGFHEPNKIHY